MHVRPCPVYSSVIHMRSVIRIRYLITFVAAMFLANNVAAAVRVPVAGPQGQDMAASQKPGATGIKHVEFVADDEAACFKHCVQAYKNPGQKFATTGSKVVFTSLRSIPYRSAGIKRTTTAVALAPQAIGPPLIILFGNLRI